MEYVNTKEAARMLGITRGALSNSLSINGSYLGVKPNKLANGRLMWPKQEIIDLLNGKQK